MVSESYDSRRNTQPVDGGENHARAVLAQWMADSPPTKDDSQVEVDNAGQMAEFFKVLSDPGRVTLLLTLGRANQLCVSELAEASGMSESSVSHHLRLLRHLQLVRNQRVGRQVFYSMDDPHVNTMLRVCTEHVRGERS